MMKRSYAGLDNYFERYTGAKRLRDLQPSTAFECGLAQRAAQDAKEGDRPGVDKEYFLRQKVPRQFAEADAMDAWQQRHRESACRGEKYTPERLFIANRLAWYAFALGWRAVPGVKWAAERIGDAETPAQFEAEVRKLVRDADAFHRRLCLKPPKEYLLMVEGELIGPLLQQIKDLCTSTTDALGIRPTFTV